MSTVVLDLANPELALDLYLSALLRETPPLSAEVATDRALTPVARATPPATRTTVPVETGSVVAAPVPIRTRDLEISQEPVVATATASAKSTPTPITTPVTTSVATPVTKPTPQATPQATPTPKPTPVKATTPEPAVAAPVPTAPFQSLLFQIAGLTVAVPLVELNGILRYPERLAAVPGLPSWGLGVIRHRDQNLVVVDSIGLFVPENLREASRSRSKPRYLIVLGGGRFGLACDSVDQVVSIKPDEVHWRGERGRRPWLAGTVKDRLCALLEVPSLVRLLKVGRLEEPNS